MTTPWISGFWYVKRAGRLSMNWLGIRIMCNGNGRVSEIDW
jgi:hypothetical protein